MTDTFSGYHPLINFIYFLFAIGIPLFFMHPVFLGISLASAIIYMIYLKGRKSVRLALFAMLPMCILSAVLNPIFVHQGQTMLLYFKNGNPLTLESIFYGIGAGCMLAAVIGWFASFHEVMTSDKFMYLFGKTLPALSLLLSMTLRFVPRFTEQVGKVRKAQECVGRDVKNGNIGQKILHGLKIFSITVTWALENSVETSDSMKSRGYGLRGRTNYSIYRFDRRDAGALCVLVAFVVGILLMIHFRWVHIQYYPVFIINPFDGRALLSYVVFAVFCFFPMAINVREDFKWKKRLAKMAE